MIPVYQPRIGEREKEFVLDAVDSTWISWRGKYVDRFESEFPAFLGSRNGIATCNGTVSIHLALTALGVGPGDEVIVPTFTYVASVNAITYTGATPVFVDSEPDYWNMDPALVEAAITPRTKAIEVVHVYGHPSDMDPIMEISGRYGIPVIEDAAEAHGAEYRGQKVGTIGLAGSFSFFSNKVITTGEGGMVVTDDDEFAQTCLHLRGQGVSPTRTYYHDVVGFNYRMTNVAAAIGCAQLEGIADVLAKKRQIAQSYIARLNNVDGVTVQREAPWAKSVYWMCSVLVRPMDRDPLMEYLKEGGVETRPFFYPAHTLPMYQRDTSYPVAEHLGTAGINLPSFPDLTEEQLSVVCDLIEGYFGQ